MPLSRSTLSTRVSWTRHWPVSFSSVETLRRTLVCSQPLPTPRTLRSLPQGLAAPPGLSLSGAVYKIFALRRLSNFSSGTLPLSRKNLSPHGSWRRSISSMLDFTVALAGWTLVYHYPCLFRFSEAPLRTDSIPEIRLSEPFPLSQTTLALQPCVRPPTDLAVIGPSRLPQSRFCCVLRSVRYPRRRDPVFRPGQLRA